MTHTTGIESWAAVQKDWMVYMALPSPTSATTGREGWASLIPSAAGSPQPMPPPRRPKKPLASRARLGGPGRAGREPLAYRLRELGQRGLGIAQNGDLGRIVLADLPRVRVHVDQGHALGHGLDVRREGEREDVAAHGEDQVVLHQELAN